MRVLDLFSGIGGFSLGLERAGMETVAFCEIEPFCQKVLRKHWPDVPCYDDITKLTYEQLVSSGVVRLVGNEIDVITAGFPCADLSQAGKRNGINGKQSGLWVEVARLAGDLRPKYIIMENSAEILVNGFGCLLTGLDKIGYDCQWFCLPAYAVGAPHLRNRFYLVAYTKGKNDGFLHQVATERQVQKLRKSSRGNGGIWADSSRVPRVADGIPSRMDRVAATGNAIIPQIVTAIGKSIMERES